MQRSKHEYIFWDWHGVLGNKGFWYSNKNNEQIKKFTNFAFSSQYQIEKWMRNQVTLVQLIKLSGARITEHELTQQLMDELFKDHAINVKYFESIKNKYPTALHVLTTDNMDVFDTFLEQSDFIKQNFAATFNSCNFGSLKKDTPSLFNFAKDQLGIKNFAHTLLIDDSVDNCKSFIDLGGNAILFKEGDS